MKSTANENSKLLYYTKNEKKKCFVAIPKDMFEFYNGQRGAKYYLLIMYLRRYMDEFGEVETNIYKIMHYLGLSSLTTSPQTAEQLKDLLTTISRRHSLSFDKDLMPLTKKETFTIFLPQDKNIFYSETPYVIFDYEEYERILNIPNKGNRATIAMVYLYIKQFFPNITSETSDDKVLKIAFPTTKKIAFALELSESTVRECINSLCEEKILFRSCNFYCKEADGTTQKTANVYSTEQKYLDDIQACKAALSHYYRKEIIYANNPDEPDKDNMNEDN